MSDHTMLDRWQTRRERRYAKQLEWIQPRLPKLRNQRARRRIVVILTATFALFPVCGGLLLYGLHGENGSLWFGAPWIVSTVILLVAWTTLNITIDAVDSAPATLLDEYERTRIESLRSLAYRVFTWVGLAAVLGMTFLGTYLMVEQPAWGMYVPYAFGIFGLGVYLALISFPSLVIAWTMPDD